MRGRLDGEQPSTSCATELKTIRTMINDKDNKKCLPWHQKLLSLYVCDLVIAMVVLDGGRRKEQRVASISRQFRAARNRQHSSADTHLGHLDPGQHPMVRNERRGRRLTAIR